MKVTRQSCPRSPSRDFAACSELFQPLACPALVPAMHCKSTVAHMAFQCVSHRFTMSDTAQGQKHHCCINCKHAKVYNSYHKTISGKENQSGHDIDPRYHVWSHQMLPLPVTCWRRLRNAPKLRRPSWNSLLGSLLGLAGFTGFAQGSARHSCRTSSMAWSQEGPPPTQGWAIDGRWVTTISSFPWFSRLASVDLQNDNISEDLRSYWGVPHTKCKSVTHLVKTIMPMPVLGLAAVARNGSGENCKQRTTSGLTLQVTMMGMATQAKRIKPVWLVVALPSFCNAASLPIASAAGLSARFCWRHVTQRWKP